MNAQQCESQVPCAQGVSSSEQVEEVQAKEQPTWTLANEWISNTNMSECTVWLFYY